MGQVLDEIEGSSQKVNSFFVCKNAKKYVEIVWDRQGGVPMREVPRARDEQPRSGGNDGESDNRARSRSPKSRRHMFG